jgi:hypothetical protein
LDFIVLASLPSGVFMPLHSLSSFKPMFIVVITTAGLMSQTLLPSIDWATACLSGRGEDVSARVCATADAGFTLAGVKGQPASGRDTVALVHVDGTGTQQWESRFDAYDGAMQYGTGVRDVNSLALLYNGGYALAGMRSISLQTPDKDAWVIRTGADGTVSWKWACGLPGGTSVDDSAYCSKSIVQARDSGFIVGGYIIRSGISLGMVWRLGADGALQWSQEFNCSCVNAVAELPDQSIVAAGGVSAVVILKIAKSGALRWQKTFHQGWQGSPTDLELSLDSGIVVAGSYGTYTGGHYFGKSYLMCLDTGGIVQWENTFGNSVIGYDVLSAVVPLAGRGYLMTGSHSYDTINSNLSRRISALWVVKAGLTGQTIWDCAFAEANFGHSVAEARDGGFVVAAERVENFGHTTSLMKMTEKPQTSVKGIALRPGQSLRAETKHGSSRVFDLLGRNIAMGKCAASWLRLRPVSGCFISPADRAGKARRVMVSK